MNTEKPQNLLAAFHYWLQAVPEANAWVDTQQSLSYRELEDKSSVLAAKLAVLVGKPGDIIVLHLQKGADMAIAILAVVKLGASYLCVEPDTPQARLEQLLQDVAPALVLTSSVVNCALPQTTRCIDYSQLPEASPISTFWGYHSTPQTCSCLFYTSGTTGKPKAVAISHQGILHMAWQPDYVTIAPGQGIGSLSTPAFDAFSFDFWAALTNGAYTVMITPDMLCYQGTDSNFKPAAPVDVLFITSALFHSLVVGTAPLLASISYLLVGGEALRPKAVRQFYRQFMPNPPQLIQVYGPTECSTFATAWPVPQNFIGDRLPIGQGIGQTQCWVLTPEGELVSEGESGELYLSGPGVALGYYADEQTTQQKFVDGHFTAPSVSCYRTGDKVRWNKQDQLEWLARIDNQVKVRGFRVDINELEQHILLAPDVEAAAVLTRENEVSIELIAFVSGDVDRLIDFLKSRVPGWMILHQVHRLPALPLTPNGKIDRQALFQSLAVQNRSQELQPFSENDAEAALRCLLRHDNFYPQLSLMENGGDSLTAMRMLSAWQAPQGQAAVTAAELLYTNPVSAVLARLQPVAAQATIVLDNDISHVASSEQLRMWFLQQRDPSLYAYATPFQFEFQGQMDEQSLEQALRILVQRHGAFRTLFEFDINSQQLMQCVVPQSDFSLEHQQVSDVAWSNWAKEWFRQPFDIGQKCALRACLLTIESERRVLLLNMHHALIDGESINILLCELSHCYAALQHNQQPGFVPLNYSLLHHTAALNLYYQQDSYKQSLNFWRARLPEILAIRRRYGLIPAADMAGERQQLMIDQQTTQAIKVLAKKQGMTFAGLLLSVLGWSWGQWQNQSAVTIGFPDAGRFLPGSENIIGMLVNTLVWHEQILPDDTLASFLDRSGKELKNIFRHHTVNYADLTELASTMQAAGQTLFDLVFVMENTDFCCLELPGLKIKSSVPDIGSAKFPFLVCLTPQGMATEVILEYQTALFSREEAHFFASQWISLLQKLTCEPAVMNTLSTQFPSSSSFAPSVIANQGQQQTHPFATLRAWLDHQRNLTPEALALVDNNGMALTYSDLMEQVACMEIFLSKQWKLSYGSVVAIYAHADRHAIIAILAMANRGICFVGLDVNYPDKLITHILTTAGIDAVMVDRANAASPLLTAQPELPLIPIDGYLQVTNWQPLPPDQAINADTLMYKVYTSDSTGLPKELAARHSLMLNIIQWQNGIGLDKPARTLQFTSLSFDISHQEICTTLCTGGTLLLPPPDFRRDHQALLRFIQTERVERLYIPYIVLQSLAETAQALKMAPDCLCEIVSAGEMLFCTEAIKDLFRKSPGSRLINMYGTSETHVVTSYTLQGEPDNWPTAVPVGYLADNCGVYIVDETNQLLADQQQIGQIAITGMHVWPCYQNNPSANQQKFCQLSLNGQHQLAYLTGDIGHYDNQGRLNYLERRDYQVKINGYREECGQLETLLLESGYFHSVAVTAQQEKLVAYLRLKSAETRVSTTELYQRLQQWLPAGALKMEFRVVDALSTTPSGKIDRAGLAGLLWYPLPDDNLSAQPNIKRQATNQRSVADWHYLLSQLIEKELGGKPNSGQTKFFAMGLTSLRLIKIHVALIQAGASTLKLNDLFEHASIDELSSFLAGESMSPPSIVSTVTEQATLNETSADQEAIAVIGMAINVSQCADLATFWRAVMDSRELVERDRSSIITNSEDKERKVTVRSSLSGIFDFDPNWFGISPQEAKRMDPQQRHLLMSVVQALENAGYSSREDLTSVGIVASTGDAFYQRWLERRNCEENHNSDPFSLGLFYQKDFVATKVAYYLGLRGPALTVQTGCSSSLVAVHQACNALNMGDAEMMVVAGVNIDPDAVQGYKWAPGHIFSKQGSTNPFSDTADGTLATNACGVVILKPLAAARRDNDRIYAVISGSAINNDGRDKAGYTAPSVAGQTKVINLALARAGIAADRIGYVEAHGTATPLGDPIEIAALSRAFLSTTSKTGFCHIASVKSQLGHAGPAAGILGLIRAALALYHQVLPANVGYERANPLLEIDKTPFTTSVTSRQWNSEELRYAGVSSFGVGGTNVHLILREPQQQERCTHSVKQTGIYLAPLSASTPQALQRLIVQLLNVMRTSSLDLSTLCARLSLHKPQSIRYLGIWNELGKAQAEMESWLTQGQNSQQILRRIDRLQNSQQLSSTQAQQYRDWLLDEESSWPISRIDNHPASWQFSITNFACAPFMLLPTGVPAKLPTKQWRYTPCWQVAVQPKMAVADLCLVIGRLPDKVQLTARQVRVLSVEEKSDQLLQQAANTAGNVQILWVSSVGESAVELLLSLTDIVQAASKWLPNRTLELDLLTVSALSTAVGEAVLPEQAMLTSALNVIMQEHPQIHCAFLDCSADSPTVAIGYGLSQHGMVHAWRRKGWLKLSYQPLAEQPLHQLSTLLPSGTYLVLGGSGGIGQALVQAIAAIAPHSQFVLVSRCVNKEPVVLHLAGQCEYESLSCDITNIAEVQSLTHLLQERYSHIQGILHCAGVPAGALIARHQYAEDFVVVEEKIRSCDALEILQALEPRWIICASSMSAIHGGVGQLSYACANGYLDAWIAAKVANQQNCCYRTINWDIWQDGGMSVQELPAGLRRHDNLLHLSTGITRREGAEMLYQTMSTPQTQQLVCTTGFTESRWFYQQHIPSRPSMAASSDLADKFSLPLIRKLYAEHLGIEESDNNTSWESMGGDSIQALDLLDELNTKSPRPFTLAEFMQLDTPEALYRFITDDTATAKPSQQISKMAVAQMILLHPIGGDLLAYREMLKMLDSRVSVIQIQDLMLDGQVLAKDTLVERAAVYCRQVLPQLKDDCPLIVVGWSFGALLAYQMVAMSELQSKKPVLIMIDPPAAYSWQTPPTDDSQLHGFAKELNYKLHDITLPQVKLLMMGKASEGLDLPPFTRNYVANLLQAFRRNLTCLRSFIPGCPPPVMTHLLYASQSQQAMQFWRQQLKTAECICIEGNHYSILNSNNGKELFSQLNRIIAIVINARAVTVYSPSIEHAVT